MRAVSIQGWVLVVVVVVVSAVLLWFFFGPKKTRRAELEAGVQTITVTVAERLIRARRLLPGDLRDQLTD